MRTARLAFALLASLAAGCADLPSLDPQTCGNGVVEPGEDCDTVAPPGARCIPRGEPSACRLSCSSGSTCPSGFGCGSDGLCRSPRGSFTRVSAPVEAGEAQPKLADFDGDGRLEVVAVGPPDLTGRRGLRLFFLEQNGVVSKSLPVPALGTDPDTRDLNQDGLADLSLNLLTGPSLLLGQQDRTLSPVAFSTFSIQRLFGDDARGYMLPIRFRSIAVDPAWFPQGPQVPISFADALKPEPISRVAFVIGTGGKLRLARDDRETTGASTGEGCVESSAEGLTLPTILDLDVLGYEPKSFFKVARSIVVGGVDSKSLGGMCDRIFVPVTKLDAVVVVSPCRAVTYNDGVGAGRKGSNNSVAWNDTTIDTDAAEVSPFAVAAPKGFSLTGPLFVIDVNHDGISDLLAGALGPSGAPRMLIAYGRFEGDLSSTPDGAHDLSFAPLEVAPSGCVDLANCAIPTPIAIGELNGDDMLDFVTPSGIYTSIPKALRDYLALLSKSPGAPQGVYPYTHSLAYIPLSIQWAEAQIADFDGDGLNDVAAAALGVPNVEVLTGNKSGLFNGSVVLTGSPVSRLTVGDVDGDHITDLLFREKGPVADEEDSLVSSTASDPLSIGDQLSVSFGHDKAPLGEPVSLGRPGVIEQIVSTTFPPLSLATFDSISDVGVISRAVDTADLTLSLLLGTSTRLPIASYGISSAQCRLVPIPVLSVTGRFNDDDVPDVAVLALDDFPYQPPQTDLTQPPPPNEALQRFWMIPGAGKGRLGARTMGTLLPKNTLPFQINNTVAQGTLTGAESDNETLAQLGAYYGARLAAADLNGDGRDEVLLMVPSDDPSGAVCDPQNPGSLPRFVCNGALIIGDTAQTADGRISVTPRAPIYFNAPVLLTGPVRVADIDLDGAPDVLFTTGSGFDGASELAVFWGDGKGGVAPEPVPLLDPSPLDVRSFALLNVEGDARPELVVLTTDSASIASHAGSRVFDVKPAPGLKGGISVAAGDVDADGVDDVVIARDGQLLLYNGDPVLR